MNNLRIRQAAARARVKHWEIAEGLGISDSALSRKLRKELPEEEQTRILGIIERIKEGKILRRRDDNTATIHYRCSFPPEWLPDAITRAAKEKYNHTLARIQKGEKWIQEHNKSALEYQQAYDGYLALRENLRKLHIVIGELVTS